MPPKEIITGHGPIFISCEDMVGSLDGNDLVCAAYEARVMWADGDRWERPDWAYAFMDDLKRQYPHHKVWSRSGDKGWLTIYFAERV
jgi:hypothetical protein